MKPADAIVALEKQIRDVEKATHIAIKKVSRHPNYMTTAEFMRLLADITRWKSLIKEEIDSYSDGERRKNLIRKQIQEIRLGVHPTSFEAPVK